MKTDSEQQTREALPAEIADGQSGPIPSSKGEPSQEQGRGGLPWWKQWFDWVVVLALAPVWVWVWVGVALIIRLGSPGPVLFRQRRVGYQGREFTLFKFRTMKVNADTETHRRHMDQLIQEQVPMVKLDAKQDPRLIPLGVGLRALGLDELPQLLNVLRGEMSLVGPRPCIPYEYERYQAHHRHRLDAVPGLTGLWQVSGKNHTTFEQMVALDIEYARRMSLWLDLKIILKTLPALWRQYHDLHAPGKNSPTDPDGEVASPGRPKSQ